MHTKFHHIFEFQTLVTLLIKIVIPTIYAALIFHRDLQNCNITSSKEVCTIEVYFVYIRKPSFLMFGHICWTFILYCGMYCFSSVLVGELVFPFVLMQFVCHVQCDKNKCLKALSHSTLVYIPSCMRSFTIYDRRYVHVVINCLPFYVWFYYYSPMLSKYHLLPHLLHISSLNNQAYKGKEKNYKNVLRLDYM